MIKCSELLGVQFAMGQYVMHCESGEFGTITDKLFAKTVPVSVYYEGLGEASGHDQVRAYFEKLAVMSKENGGLLRLDMPHTQVVTVNGDCAVGQWETMTFRIIGAAFGNDLIEAPLDYAIGRYENKFVLEEGLWKLQSIYWKPVIEFGNWKAKDATKVYGRPYPKPFEELRAIDDDTASPESVATCDVRNQALAFFRDFNHKGLCAIDGRFGADAAREAGKMLKAPCTVNGYWGSVLATSPIVAIEKDRARLYLNVGRILPVGETQIAHSRGRVCAELVNCDGQWKFTEFHWYRYATMLPWDVRNVRSC